MKAKKPAARRKPGLSGEGTRVLVRHYTLDKLRNAITVGRYPPGSRLVERELCESLGVSRTSVREALRQLQSEHLVEVGPRRNIRVATISASAAEDIYLLREALEAIAVRRFATSAAPAARKRLQKVHGDLRKAIAARDTFSLSRMAGAFYETVLSGAASRVVSEVALQLLARVNYLRFQSMSVPGRLDDGLREWDAIMDAIAARDADAAAAAMIQHLRNSRAAVVGMLIEGPPDQDETVSTRSS